MKIDVEPIGTIINNYKTKFAIPRQSGLNTKELSTIVFEEKYRDANALRGLEHYSHVWLIWYFSDNNSNKDWSPTVRPPRLGGNKRMGVFATRSPYHPNRLGLSCVKIEDIVKTQNDGTVIVVSGADLMNGTPIIDIKPYLSFSDSHPDAICGFADEVKDYKLNVEFEKTVIDMLSDNDVENIKNILSQDPAPSYIDDKERIYGFEYANYNIKFTKDDTTIFVVQIEEKGGDT